MQSSTKATGRQSISASLLATERSDIDGSRLPLGRPRCEAKMIFAPRSTSKSSVGKVSLIRVTSVMTICPAFSSKGTLKSTRTNTRLQRTFKSLTVSFAIFSLGAENIEGNQSVKGNCEDADGNRPGEVFTFSFCFFLSGFPVLKEGQRQLGFTPSDDDSVRSEYISVQRPVLFMDFIFSRVRWLLV